MSSREGGAGGLEIAVVAERADIGAEVLGMAGSFYRGPDGGCAFALAPDGLLAGDGRDRQRLAQVQEPYLGGRLAEHALAQERIGLHPAEAAALEALARSAARLVVHDDQAAVGEDVEAVDDAAQAKA